MMTIRLPFYWPDDDPAPAKNIWAPITRMERIMSGEDVEPLTREEYFMKQLVASISTTAATAAAAVLPEYKVADDGKVLKVDTEGSGADEKAVLVWATDETTAAEDILPAYAVADKGKVLKVDTTGSGADEKAILGWATDETTAAAQ